MCKGCVASELTINLLRRELEREHERADKFEKLALSLSGIVNEAVEDFKELPQPVKGKSTWSELRHRLEAADRKKFNELTKNVVPEGQEG